MTIASNALITILKGAAKDTRDEDCLLIACNGKRHGYWKFVYTNPATGKRTKVSLGECWVDSEGKKVLGMDLKDAREARNAKRIELAQLADGKNLHVVAKEAAAAIHAATVVSVEAAADAARRKAMSLPPKDSFRDAAMRCIDANRTRKDSKTINLWEKSLAKYAYPLFGDKPVAEVTAVDINAMQERLMTLVQQDKRSKTGHAALITARRYCRHVFDWACHPKIALRTLANPVFVDETIFDDKPEAESHAAMIEQDDVRELVLAIRAPVPAQAEWDLRGGRYPTPTVGAALRFALLVGQRPHNIATARFADFHLDAAIPTWVIPALQMKGTLVKKRRASAEAHVVYLSKQAVAIIRAQRAANPGCEFVFPGQFKSRGKAKAMDKNSLGGRLNAMGFKDKQTAHGFRVTMRTAGAHFAGCDVVVLESMLNHKAAKDSLENGGMPGVYDRTEQLLQDALAKRCSEAAQRWADWLDELQRPRLALAA